MTTPITLAPHLARAVESMSKDLAVAPEALVNQAVFAWLRTNGYEAPRPVAPAAVVAPEPVAPVAPGLSKPVEDGPSQNSPAVPSSTGSDRTEEVRARMAEIDADLEKLTKPLPAWVEDAEEEQEEEEATAAQAPAVEEEEEPHTGKVPVEPEPEEEEAPESTIVLRSVPIALYLQRGEAEPLRITKERFVVGRGPHCDLVIDSPRVSREHVALTRAGISYFIEDLGSSNGTWFGEERVTKRELESGDVINLGNEPVKFFLRGE